jgi:hypothetical protein
MPEEPAEEEKLVVCDLKTREQWLRDEVKQHRALLFSLLQWGMTLLAVSGSATYFIRRDLAQAIMNQPYVVPAQVLAPIQWFAGTAILFGIAILFSLMTLNLLLRYYSYRDQLNATASQHSQIKDGKVKRLMGLVPLVFLWSFPLLDCYVWWKLHK